MVNEVINQTLYLLVSRFFSLGKYNVREKGKTVIFLIKLLFLAWMKLSFIYNQYRKVSERASHEGDNWDFFLSEHYD